eukprot:CAMPEP_0114983120 /NCGR_PEP_ID=MMETSP0216-20121206/6520_1 /TAXON_ID=223996 /ORGANISM="Protocruzia adherens, Strain Boccale" /LENGTH=128 /DNA_ID=CAMNT_0002345061 /DNA_START=290 /DNA_END=676 /DNA_ORIENTATION=+
MPCRVGDAHRGHILTNLGFWVVVIGERQRVCEEGRGVVAGDERTRLEHWGSGGWEGAGEVGAVYDGDLVWFDVAEGELVEGLGEEAGWEGELAVVLVSPGGRGADRGDFFSLSGGCDGDIVEDVRGCV